VSFQRALYSDRLYRGADKSLARSTSRCIIIWWWEYLVWC